VPLSSFDLQNGVASLLLSPRGALVNGHRIFLDSRGPGKDTGESADKNGRDQGEADVTTVDRVQK
jgi:hypothetical protein